MSKPGRDDRQDTTSADPSSDPRTEPAAGPHTDAPHTDAPHTDAPSTEVDRPARHQRRIDDLIRRIKESADQLAEDGSTRGDLKILSRALRELRYAFKVFAPYRRHRKVTVFGSARTGPDHPAYQHAVQFGQAMASHHWLVVTGAARGIMEAGHQGAGRAYSMGLNIMLPFEQEANPVIAGDPKLVYMKYFFTRKLMFVKECDAVVCFPGGFGTLDEALEVLTLLQTGKRDMVPVVLIDAPGGSYWRDFDRFVRHQLLDEALISGEDLHLYKVTDRVDDAVAEILQFYREYHSMRYVGDQLVLRLRHAPAAATLATLHNQFSDLLVEGSYTVASALPEERDEPDLNHLSRLVFTFNRRNQGRLRAMIDYLNAQTPDRPAPNG